MLFTSVIRHLRVSAQFKKHEHIFYFNNLQSEHLVALILKLSHQKLVPEFPERFPVGDNTSLKGSERTPTLCIKWPLHICRSYPPQFIEHRQI